MAFIELTPWPGDTDTEIELIPGLDFSFTFKNMVAFFTIFAWSGIASMDAGYSKDYAGHFLSLWIAYDARHGTFVPPT